MFKSRNLKKREGFTLIELMIVVAIIGILAAIAIPNFLRFQLKARSSEGKVNLSAIRTAETSYMSEFGLFIAAVGAPAAVPGATKGAFPAVGSAGGFDTIGWRPEGMVYFQYAVALPVAGAGVSPGFTATAVADIDGDAVNQEWGYVKASTTPIAVSACPASGVYNPISAANDLLDTVGPCTDTSGTSVF